MHRPRRLAALLVVLPSGLSGCGDAAAPTWSDAVAAIVHTRCAPCHRPGEPAPFPLLTFDDAFRKRRQIGLVTDAGLMPPWLPANAGFHGDRRLTGDERAALRDWVAADGPRGDPAAEPAVPTFADGWYGPAPDLVLEATEDLLVPADGLDQFRNLVLPVPIDRLRHIAAVEIRPGSRAVHHAILRFDPTAESRRLDAADPEPGFAGMAMGLSRAPDGHFLGWTPGRRETANAGGLAFRLWPGDDAVLQLHLVPTGKVELVRPRIGLHFAAAPSTVQPVALVLQRQDIDIPAGEADHRIRDEVTLPVATRLLAIYPHAHRLCRRMLATATLPDGTTRVLLDIPAWDFDWQEDYRYAQPPELRAGTRVAFDYAFDNSAANERNPHRPPRRVVYGLRSDDEMATLTLMLTADAGERPRLVAAAARHAAEREPAAVPAWVALCQAELSAGSPAAATAAVQRALALDPGSAAALTEWAGLQERDGELPAAERTYRAALAADPQLAVARLGLGTLLGRANRPAEAIAQFEAALRTHPHLPELHNNLATAFFATDRLDEAAAHYRRAVLLDDGYFHAWLNLGRVLAASGRAAEAGEALQRAAGLRPGDPAVRDALRALGR